MTSLSTLDYVENFTISKSISDQTWQLTMTMDKDDAPEPLIGIRAFATDHASVEHCLFIGFIPGAQYIRKIAGNKVSITAYDFSWYLTAQTVATHCRRRWVDEWTAFSWIMDLIGGYAEGENVTGLKLCTLNDYEIDCTYPGYLSWNAQETKMKAIQDMCDICEKLFWIRFKETATDVYSSCITWVSPVNLDNFLPAMVTFTEPSDYVVNVHINVNRMERYNRICVYGTDPTTGDWYEKILETAAVTAAEEKPIDYVVEDDKLTSQAKVDAKAAALYTKLQTVSPDTYSATLTNRYDLELLQKVKFVGYNDIPEIDMRITAISYQRQLNNDKVIISFTEDQTFAEFKTLDRSAEPDIIQTQEQVIRKTIQGIANLQIGTVTKIEGNVATIILEREGTEVTARILT